jgi:hypothetical protein
MATAPPALAEAAIIGPISELIRRIEIYESDGSTPWTGGIGLAGNDRLIDGNVSVDYTRDERRAFDLTLDNTDDGIVHDPAGFWYDKIIKVYHGVSYTDYTTLPGVDKTWETQIGEFMIDSISQDYFPAQIKVTGRDYTKKCMLSQFTQATTFTATSTIENVIKGMAGNAGITKYNVPLTGKTLGIDYFFERGTSRWEAMKQIATAFGYELFFDSTGYLTMRDFQDPITAPVAYVLQTGTFGNLVSFSKSTSDSLIYNHVVITGESSDSTVVPVMAEAKNTTATSPTRIAKLGDRVYQYSSAFITTQAQAQDLANKWLKIYAMEQYDIDFSSIVLAWLEAGTIVQFLDPDPAPGQPDKFLLTNFTIPLGLGPMSGNAKRVTVVG